MSRPITPEDPNATLTTIATGPPGSTPVAAPASPETIKQTVREIYLQAVRNAHSSMESLSQTYHSPEPRSPVQGSPVGSPRASAASPDVAESPRAAGDTVTSPRSPRDNAGKLSRASSAIFKIVSEGSPRGSRETGSAHKKSKHRHEQGGETDDPVSWILD